MDTCSVTKVTSRLRFLWVFAAVLLAGAILAGPATGALARNGSLSFRGCVSGETESGPLGSGGTGACATIFGDSSQGANTGLDAIVSLALSWDGRSLYTSAVADDAVAHFRRTRRTGVLAYRGCLSGERESGTIGSGGSGACARSPTFETLGVNSGFDDLRLMVLSRDGKWLYAASAGDAAVVRLRRNPRTGALTFRSCLSGETQSGPAGAGGSGACTLTPTAASQGANSGLHSLRSLALSRDGKWLYASSFLDDAVARFRRNVRTGALSFRGCISGETESGPAGSGACRLIPAASSQGTSSGLDSVREVALSRDEKSLYALGYDDDAVAHFRRNARTGALTYRGCISGETESGPVPAGGSGACRAVPRAGSLGASSGLDGPRSGLAVSRSGRSLYVTSQLDDAVASFARNARTGALTFRGCITGETQSGPGGSRACRAVPRAAALGENSGLDDLRQVVPSGNGRWLYASSVADAAVVRFARNRRTGRLAFRGCVTGDIESGPAGLGGSGACGAISSASPGGFGDESGLEGLIWVALSGDGRWLYAVGQGDDAVARFRRAP